MVPGPTLALAVAVVVLVVVNLLNNRIAPRAYLPTSLLATGVLLALLLAAGLGWADAGLSAATTGRGALWGFAGLAVVAIVYLVGALLPATRPVFADRRVEGAGRGEVAYQTLVRIPLGTVILEEVAFRGVLYGLLTAEYGVVGATAVSSVLFGLWHVLPSGSLTKLNPTAGRAFGTRPALAIAVAVLASALAGLVLCELRRVSGSLLAPMMVHWATNALGYVTAFLVAKRVAVETPSVR